jgi:hypothetical protein
MSIATHSRRPVLPLLKNTHFIYYRAIPKLIDSKAKFEYLREGEGRKELAGCGVIFACTPDALGLSHGKKRRPLAL